MAQGFKTSKAGASSSKATQQKKTAPKRGMKVIAPKKKSAVELASQKKKQTASLTKKIEADMAGRASGGGPLTIMKKLGKEASDAKESEKQRKIAKAKAKGRAQ